jgi:hypothetical protein
VGKNFAGPDRTTLENVENVVVVQAEPGLTSMDGSDVVAAVGNQISSPDCALRCGADTNIEVKTNHDQFKVAYESDGSNGTSAKEIVDKTYVP